jgi:hypothetical protein
MRDDACQGAGLSGDPIKHPALNAFIARNYEADSDGRWFFQNGPQRVYVDLAYTPFVVRWHRGTAAPSTPNTPTDAATHATLLVDQCGNRFEPQACWLDDEGQVLFSRQDTTRGRPIVALLHDHDLALFSEHVTWRDGGILDAPGIPDTLHWPMTSWREDGGGSQAGNARDVALPITAIHAADVATRFGFVQRPKC